LPGAFYRAPGKDFAECKSGTRQRKVAVTAPAPSAFDLPGAMSEAPGKVFLNYFFIFYLPSVLPGAKIFYFFFTISLPGAMSEAPGKYFFIFSLNFLCRVSLLWAPGKEFFYFF
jgi:hypothetical protein